MNTAQASMVATLVLLLIGRLFQAITTKHNPVESLLNVGVPAALSALAGGLAVLISRAQVLQNVSKIADDRIISANTSLRTHGLSRFGSTLLLDDVWVYVVWAIALGVILFEIKIAAPKRETPPVTLTGWMRYLGLGLAIPAAFGAAALYIIYKRS